MRIPALLIVTLCSVVGCATSMHGMTPVYPEMAGLSFPNVDSLRPTLKWTPSAEVGATYDIVIYEAIESSLPTMNPTIGKTVSYQKGLKDPEYTVPSPLKPNAKYYWSVRLRKDGKVSSWSTFDFKAFYGVGFSRGDRLIFRFGTPKI